MEWWEILLMVVGIVGGGFLVVRFGLVPLLSRAPKNLGVHEGRLAPCPASPNCVCSQADPADQTHHVAPLPFEGAVAGARERFLAILPQVRGKVRVVETTPAYIRAEVRTPLFGFVDDVEVYLDEAVHLVHFRSASRLGYGDLGANRARVERLKALFEGTLE